MDYKAARDMLVSTVRPVSEEEVDLEAAAGRILARKLIASENVPAFDRSPYDGYAFRAADTKGACRGHPVTLKILEEVPAGSVPSGKIIPGTAAKVLTGASIPDGADAVIMYEKTDFNAETVTIYEEARPGDNIIYAGEDVRRGSILAQAGSIIDAGLCGSLASQGELRPMVHRRPVVGIISTGNELVDPDMECCKAECTYMKNHEPAYIDIKDQEKPDIKAKVCELPEADFCVPAGKIINSNRYTLAAALRKDGCIPVYLGTAGDDVRRIAELIQYGSGGDLHPDRLTDLAAFSSERQKSAGPGFGREMPASLYEQPGSAQPAGCDMIILTGGVSAGDYDLTPEAMEYAGCSLLVKGVMLKPGMACCYGERDGKLVCALSGNPASSLTNYYAVVRPAVRKLAGLANYMPQTFTVALADDFKKKSKVPRILKGKLEISEQGEAMLHIPAGQGNTMISSSIGCDCMAELAAGSGPAAAGTKLQAFLI